MQNIWPCLLIIVTENLMLLPNYVAAIPEHPKDSYSRYHCSYSHIVIYTVTIVTLASQDYAHLFWYA